MLKTLGALSGVSLSFFASSFDLFGVPWSSWGGKRGTSEASLTPFLSILRSLGALGGARGGKGGPKETFGGPWGSQNAICSDSWSGFTVFT